MAIVYKTTNTLNNKFYIGVHDVNSVNTKRYLGSGNTLKKAIKKYGRENFVRETLAEFDDKVEAYEYERWLVNEYLIGRPDCYNLVTGGAMPPSHKGRALTDEHRNAVSRAQRGVPNPPEQVEAQRLAMTGRKYSEEHRANIGKSNKGKRLGCKVSEETKLKISKAKTGTKASEETKEKMRSSHLGKTMSHKGKPWSEARREAQNKRKINK